MSADSLATAQGTRPVRGLAGDLAGTEVLMIASSADKVRCSFSGEELNWTWNASLGLGLWDPLPVTGRWDYASCAGGKSFKRASSFELFCARQLTDRSKFARCWARE